MQARKGSDDSKEDKMVHHYITRYEESGRRWVVAWIQVDLLGLCLCLSQRKTEAGGAA